MKLLLQIINLPFLLLLLLLAMMTSPSQAKGRCCFIRPHCDTHCEWFCKCHIDDVYHPPSPLKLLDETDPCPVLPCGSQNAPGGSIGGNVVDNTPYGVGPAPYTINLAGRSSEVQHDKAEEEEEQEYDEDAPWFDHVTEHFEGTDLQRCFKRHGVAPQNGSACERLEKTCFLALKTAAVKLALCP